MENFISVLLHGPAAQAGMPERAKTLMVWQHLVWHVCLQPPGDAVNDPG